MLYGVMPSSDLWHVKYNDPLISQFEPIHLNRIDFETMARMDIFGSHPMARKTFYYKKNPFKDLSQFI